MLFDIDIGNITGINIYTLYTENLYPTLILTHSFIHNSNKHLFKIVIIT